MLIQTAHEAERRGHSQLLVWGSGTPRREFLHVDGLAYACVFLLQQGVADCIYNNGAGEDLTIRELAERVISIVGFQGGIVFDATKPDGTPRKLRDVSRKRTLGWRARMPLSEGIALAYRDFLSRHGC